MKKVLIIIMVLWFIPVYANERVEVAFLKCVDGDTAKFLLNNKEITARFLAIDTPETVHPQKKAEPYGKEASDYTCNSLNNANKIILEYDDDSDRQDKYKRHLVWVFYDDKFLQEELINLGYAKIAYLYGDYQYTIQLQEVERNAKEKHLGLWSDDNDEDILDEYTVTFSYNGKSKKIKVKGGMIVSPISNPKKEDYRFIGWYLDNEIYDFSIPVNKDLKLIAKFEPLFYEVPFYIYILAIIIFLIVVLTNYKGINRKIKRKLKKKLIKIN